MVEWKGFEVLLEPCAEALPSDNSVLWHQTVCSVLNACQPAVFWAQCGSKVSVPGCRRYLSRTSNQVHSRGMKFPLLLITVVLIKGLSACLFPATKLSCVFVEDEVDEASCALWIANLAFDGNVSTWDKVIEDICYIAIDTACTQTKEALEITLDKDMASAASPCQNDTLHKLQAIFSPKYTPLQGSLTYFDTWTTLWQYSLDAALTAWDTISSPSPDTPPSDTDSNYVTSGRSYDSTYYPTRRTPANTWSKPTSSHSSSSSSSSPSKSSSSSSKSSSSSSKSSSSSSRGMLQS